jgi:hypothetical protein
MHCWATATIVDEAQNLVAEKWHFLALFGRFWRALECQFFVFVAGDVSAQTVNLLGFYVDRADLPPAILRSAKSGLVGALP